jgi:alpha-D-ribose 1-methylphosphonate 5-triphosphate synthase subunit PhnG
VTARELVETPDSARAAWMGTLAKARPPELAALWGAATRPGFGFVRPPETGLVMVRGRTGGTGPAFNLGEMTVTRCVVRLDSGETGVGYVAGRDKDHAAAAACLDAMMQSERHRDSAAGVIGALADAAKARSGARSRKAAATKVEFFTMVRDRAPG